MIQRAKSDINGSWQNLEVVGIPGNGSYNVNRLKLVEGNETMTGNEILMIDSFASYYGFSIGDNVILDLPLMQVNVTIAGLVESVEFLSYEFLQEGVIYIDQAQLQTLSSR